MQDAQRAWLQSIASAAGVDLSLVVSLHLHSSADTGFLEATVQHGMYCYSLLECFMHEACDKQAALYGIVAKLLICF
jgi:hypothetical protein